MSAFTNDVLMVAVIRLPTGEEPYMRDAIEEDAPTMNSDRAPAIVTFRVDSVADSDLATALNVLGVDVVRLVA